VEDNSVDRILSEDCLEHIEEKYYPDILEEAYRMLRSGGIFRLAVPDYRHPKDRFCLERGFDSRENLHVTLTTYELLKKHTDTSSFETADYRHYWDGDKFIYNEIDYSLGHVKRTPDHDNRNFFGAYRDGVKVGENKFFMTSIVVDLIKL
jgi:predicted SAM-dependent methyltransferase